MSDLFGFAFRKSDPDSRSDPEKDDSSLAVSKITTPARLSLLFTLAACTAPHSDKPTSEEVSQLIAELYQDLGIPLNPEPEPDPPELEQVPAATAKRERTVSEDRNYELAAYELPRLHGPNAEGVEPETGSSSRFSNFAADIDPRARSSSSSSRGYLEKDRTVEDRSSMRLERSSSPAEKEQVLDQDKKVKPDEDKSSEASNEDQEASPTELEHPESENILLSYIKRGISLAAREVDEFTTREKADSLILRYIEKGLKRQRRKIDKEQREEGYNPHPDALSLEFLYRDRIDDSLFAVQIYDRNNPDKPFDPKLEVAPEQGNSEEKVVFRGHGGISFPDYLRGEPNLRLGLDFGTSRYNVDLSTKLQLEREGFDGKFEIEISFPISRPRSRARESQSLSQEQINRLRRELESIEYSLPEIRID